MPILAPPGLGRLHVDRQNRGGQGRKRGKHESYVGDIKQIGHAIRACDSTASLIHFVLAKLPGILYDTTFWFGKHSCCQPDGQMDRNQEQAMRSIGKQN